MFKTKSVQIDELTVTHRHPFGRFDAIRARAETGQECAECGQPARFHYGMWSDSGSEGPWVYTEAFCSRGCYKSFYSYGG